MYFDCPNVILTSNYYNYYYEKKDNYIQAAKYYHNGSRLICLTVWFFVNPHIFHLKYGQLIDRITFIHVTKFFLAFVELILIPSDFQEREQKKE